MNNNIYLWCNDLKTAENNREMLENYFKDYDSDFTVKMKEWTRSVRDEFVGRAVYTFEYKGRDLQPDSQEYKLVRLVALFISGK